jgi:hypothetical protein
MEDVMFVHKSMPIALSFAATMALSLAAGPAQADRQQNSYCSAPEVCNQRQIGIIQKERDGVNYFYGGSDVPPPQVTYIYLKGDDIDQSAAEPIYTSNSYNTSFSAPLSNHRFRMKKDHWNWKKKHPGPLDLPGLNAGVNYRGP